MGTFLGKMLSSLKLNRNRYKRYEEEIKELRKVKDNESKPFTKNKSQSGRTRNPEKRRAFEARGTKIKK